MYDPAGLIWQLSVGSLFGAVVDFLIFIVCKDNIIFLKRNKLNKKIAYRLNFFFEKASNFQKNVEKSNNEKIITIHDGRNVYGIVGTRTARGYR